MDEKAQRAEIMRIRLSAEKNRSDYLGGLWAFQAALAISLHVLEEEGEVNLDRFLSALDEAVSYYTQKLSSDESSQFQKILDDFRGMVEDTRPQ